jgi:hypothetical protein
MHLILRILKSLEQTQESKYFKISFQFFVKMLDGLNLTKDASQAAVFETLSEFENYEIFLRKF